ncbi:hypothetical protein [Subtercola endophyticus]|uniref:hypothetical protein n=1 Tax=Subtercola endophyticus TaxID=2895559 RepID=UPI001E468ADB|nr:hypothetical protein [Subtercola endophyticus]UFS59487.1 hypothetical protein LQ955_01410 [Subtercola endophyticus]
MQPFIPEIWSEGALDSIRSSTVMAPFLKDPNPKTINVKVPRSPEWIASRDLYTAEWQELTDKLIGAGFLEYDEDGCLGVNTADHTYVRQENPDYDPDYKPAELTVTIPSVASGGLVVNTGNGSMIPAPLDNGYIIPKAAANIHREHLRRLNEPNYFPNPPETPTVSP